MKKNEIYYHLVGWSFYLLYKLSGVIVFKKEAHDTTFFQILHIVESVLAFYIGYLILFPLFLKNHGYLKLVSSIVSILLGFAFIEFIFLHFLIVYKYMITPLTSYHSVWVNAFDLLMTLALCWPVYIYFSNIREFGRKSLIEIRHEAEMDFIKNQVNPHFLFNYLNYLYSLAYPLSENLANEIMDFTRFTRYKLSAKSGKMVDISEEIAYVEFYISMIQKCLGNSIFTHFQIKNNFSLLQVPALLFTTLIQGILKVDLSNDVNIEIELLDRQLQFIILKKSLGANQSVIETEELNYARDLLESVYPNKHKLAIVNEREFCRLELLIETN